MLTAGAHLGSAKWLSTLLSSPNATERAIALQASATSSSERVEIAAGAGKAATLLDEVLCEGEIGVAWSSWFSQERFKDSAQRGQSGISGGSLEQLFSSPR
jgi:hypothetical protein